MTVPALSGEALLLSEREAARRLRVVSARSLQRLRLEGGGPPFVQLTGRRLGYLAADLDAWVAGQRRDRPIFKRDRDATASASSLTA